MAAPLARSIRDLAGRLARGCRRLLLPLVLPARWQDWSRLTLADPARKAVSLDPGIYRDGLLYDEQDGFRLIPLGDPAPQLVFPAYRYDRPSPELFGGSLDLGHVERAIAGRTRPRGAATVEACLPEALLFHDAIYVRRDETLYALYEGSRATDRLALYPLRASDLRLVEVIDEPDAFFLGSPGSFNYGHWLVDDLTRAPDRPATFIMTDHGALMNARRIESLSLALGAAPRVRFIAPDKPVVVRRLRYVSQPTYHPGIKSPEALHRAVERITAALPPGGTGARRLFIHRSAERSVRGLLNDREIADLLAGRGFTVLDFMEADAAEQARACRQADLIVGVMGAAMTNTMFARPGTRLVYLSPQGWIEPFYWDLAAVLGHRYQCLFGETTGTGDPWRLSFTIDPALLARVLDAP